MLSRAVAKLERTAREDPVKVVVAGTVGVMVVVRRDEWWLDLVLGGVVSSLVVKVLKGVVSAPRPVGATKTDAGMPSSHAHQLAYLATYVGMRPSTTTVLSLPFNLTVSLTTDRADALALAGTVALAVATGLHRVGSREHTPAQVVVGYVTGALVGLAVCWFLDEKGYARVTSSLLANSSEEAKLGLILVSALVGAALMGRVGRFLAKKRR